MDEIIPGAQSIDLEGTRNDGILLFHGFGDSPHSLRYLASHLNKAGYSVRAPLLPGHGRSVEDFDVSTSEDWIRFGASELAGMRERCDRVAVGGLSMGGAIAAVTAAGDRDIPALILVAPYLGMPPILRAAAAAAPILRLFIKQMGSQSPLSVRDPVERARGIGYGVSTPNSVRQLWRMTRKARACLPDISAPSLIIQSREDNRIKQSIAERSLVELGSAEKKLVLTRGAGHVITVDYGRDRVFTEVQDWLDTHLSNPGHHHSGVVTGGPG